MTDTHQKQPGNTLWKIAADLRGAMNADDFRDDMLSSLFLRSLSDNDETAATKELGKEYYDLFNNTLKTHKKGLMQQMFPAPTEQAS